MTDITTLPAPVLVTGPQALRLLARTLNNQEIIAVDTESNSLYAYQEQVCLIQFSTLEGDYLVDPLALEDLSALGEVFANPKVEKVFHAAEYDLICLQRDFDFRFENLFDTMIAARVLGREAVGLAAMLGEHFGIEVDKRHQRANWGRRPLAAEMLAYAQQDTHYLIELSARMRAELEASGRWALAAEDFERLAHANYAGALKRAGRPGERLLADFGGVSPGAAEGGGAGGAVPLPGSAGAAIRIGRCSKLWGIRRCWRLRRRARAGWMSWGSCMG